VRGISREALRALTAYKWPGNVRELENAIERAVIIASGRQIELDDLPEAIHRVAPARGELGLGTESAAAAPDDDTDAHTVRSRPAGNGEGLTLEIDVPATMDEVEQLVIQATLDYTSGDKTAAARTLGIGRKTLYRKLEQYNGMTDEQE
jgi:DNA-binding NtrC family response regulator